MTPPGSPADKDRDIEELRRRVARNTSRIEAALGECPNCGASLVLEMEPNAYRCSNPECGQSYSIGNGPVDEEPDLETAS